MHVAADRYRPFVERVEGSRWLAHPGDSAFPRAINGQGHIVGSVSWNHERDPWPRKVRGYLWIDGEAHELDELVDDRDDRPIAHANAIDDAGTILATVGGPSHAVLLRRCAMVPG